MRRLAAALAVLALSQYAAKGDAAGEAVLREHLRNGSKATFTGSEAISERLADGQPAKVTCEVRRMPDRSYQRYRAASPAAYNGVTKVRNQHRTVIYMPAERRAYVFQSSGPNPDPEKTLEHLTKRYEVTLEGDETVAGRTCRHLKLSPRKGGPEVEFWVDSQQDVLLRRRVASGDRLFEERCFSRVDFNTSLDDEDFGFRTPRGVQEVAAGYGQRVEPVRVATPAEVRRIIGVRMMQPDWLPDGYQPKEKRFAIQAPNPFNLFQRRVSVAYFRDNRMLLLSQGFGAFDRRGGGGDDAQTPRVVKPGVVFWTNSGVRLALVGPRDMPEADLLHCAESVDWADG